MCLSSGCTTWLCRWTGSLPVRGSRSTRPSGTRSRRSWSGSLGRGVRLWDGLDGLRERYTVETVTVPSGATHVFFAR